MTLAISKIPRECCVDSRLPVHTRHVQHRRRRPTRKVQTETSIASIYIPIFLSWSRDSRHERFIASMHKPGIRCCTARITALVILSCLSLTCVSSAKSISRNSIYKDADLISGQTGTTGGECCASAWAGGGSFPLAVRLNHIAYHTISSHLQEHYISLYLCGTSAPAGFGALIICLVWYLQLSFDNIQAGTVPVH